MDKLFRSINSILYERITGPLSGTFFFSWAVLNWKIIYLTFFVPTSKLDMMKIDFITTNYFKPQNLWLWPLVSTAVILTAYPWLSNKVYWLAQWYKTKKIKIKQEFEDQQPLEIDKSMQLRSELKNARVEFNRFYDDKVKEVSRLEDRIKELLVEKNEVTEKLDGVNDGIAILKDIQKNNTVEISTLKTELSNKEDKIAKLKISLSPQTVIDTIKGNLTDMDKKRFVNFTGTDEYKYFGLIAPLAIDEGLIAKKFIEEIRITARKYQQTGILDQKRPGTYTLTDMGKKHYRFFLDQLLKGIIKK